MLPVTTRETDEILAVARDVARRLDDDVSTAYLALALLESLPEREILGFLFAKLGIKREEAALYARSFGENRLEKAKRDGKTAQMGPHFTESALEALEWAEKEAARQNQRAVSPEALLLGLVAPQKGPHVGEVWRPLGLESAVLRREWRSILEAQNPYPAHHPLGMLDDGAKNVVKSAHEWARKTGSGRIASGHLLLALIEHPESRYWLENAGLVPEKLAETTKAGLLSDGETFEAKPKWAPDARGALERARDETGGIAKISPRLLLVGLLAPVEGVKTEKLDFAAQILEPHADEIRLSAFVFDRRPSKGDWPFHWGIFALMTAFQFALGLVLTGISYGEIRPIHLLYFVPICATGAASRFFGLEKWHFNALAALILATVLLWMFGPLFTGATVTVKG